MVFFILILMFPVKTYLLCFLLCFFSNLYTAIAQQPDLVLPVGHTQIVRTARFSPDGKYVLTGGADKLVNIWETFSGKKIRSLEGNNSDISYAFFSNDSKYIAVGTDSTVIIWSVPAYSIVGNFALVRKSLFSPDGRKLFLQEYNGHVKQISLPSMAIEYDYADNVIYGRDYGDLVSRVSISPDSRLVCNAADSQVTIRDINTGSIVVQKGVNGITQRCFFTPDGNNLVAVTSQGIQNLDGKNNFAVTALSKEDIESAYLSSNNRFLLTSSDYIRGRAMLWDFEIRKPVFSSDTVRSLSDTMAVTDSNDNVRIITGPAAFAFPHMISSRGVVISNDGKYLSIPDVIWDRFDNTKSYQVRENFLRKADISPDNRYLLVRFMDEETVCLWDLVTQKILQSYQTRADKIRIAAISPDGKKMLAAGEGNSMKIFDLNTGQLSRVLQHQGKISYGGFSKDGTRVLTNSFDSTAKLWDVATGMLLQNYPGQHPDFSPAYFSNDGQMIFSPVIRDTVPVYNDKGDIIKYELIGNYYNPEKIVNAPNTRSNSGRYRLYENNNTGELSLVDSLNKNSVMLFSGNDLNAFSPDEKLLVLSDNARMDTLVVWDIENRKTNMFLGVSMNSAGLRGRRGFSQLLFTPDNKYLLVTDVNAVIHGFSTADFKEVFRLPGQRCSISNDSKRLLVVNEGKCELYDFEKKQLLFSYIFVDSVNYLVFDPQKRFDGTEMARKMLYYSCGNEIIDLDQAKDQLWVPNLAKRIINGDRINAKTLDQLNICGLTPEVKEASSNLGEYHFKINPRRGGLGETIVSVNGNPTKTFPPEQLIKNDGVYDLIIQKKELLPYFMEGEENSVTVKAYTSNNTISSRGLVIKEVKTKEATTPPNLYAVMVGVSDYKGDELDLKYAAKDATDISAVISNSAKKMLNTDGKEHVFMYNLTTASDHYLLPEKNSIQKTLEEIGKKATANDILLIFFAGHGVMEDLPTGDKKQFYFLTADASNASTAADVGISTAELTEWMKPAAIKAQKRILIFDACNSGQAINDIAGKDLAVRNDDKAQQIKVIDKLNEKSGLFILSASATNQSAYEMGRYSHGLLTYALLKCIKQQPDILEDGKYLNLARWFDAAGKTVNALSKENGARQDPQIVSNTNFNIGEIDETQRSAINLPINPLFASSAFVNSDEGADGDDLKLSRMINLHLENRAGAKDNTIDFTKNAEDAAAITLAGRYDVKGNEVVVRISIKKNDQAKYRFEEKGKKDNLIALAAVIVEKATGWVAANK